jgi:outer membrane immunogenic protein
MKKLLFASGTLAALIAAGPAMAADQGIRVPAPAYAPVSDWTGFYVGGHVGYGWGHDPYTDNGFSQSAQGNVSNSTLNVNPATLTGTDPKGAVGGGHFGYNQQWGNWVGGLEIDISATDMKATTAASSTTTNTATLATIPPITTTTTLTTGVSEEDKFDLLGTARARLGGLVWSNTLLYATGGLAWTHFVRSQTATVSSTTTGQGTAVGTLATRVPNWMFGWVAGAGAETKIYNSNWLFRVEYLHYDFGDQLSSVGTQVTPGVVTQNFGRTSGTLTADVVRAGLSYKFGGPIY